MQYGNEDMQEKANEIDKFKSYYVVWKQEKSVDEMEIIDRLNRTMQYGNITKKIYEKISNIV